jgi:hypothetical protein
MRTSLNPHCKRKKNLRDWLTIKFRQALANIPGFAIHPAIQRQISVSILLTNGPIVYAPILKSHSILNSHCNNEERAVREKKLINQEIHQPIVLSSSMPINKKQPLCITPIRALSLLWTDKRRLSKRNSKAKTIEKSRNASVNRKLKGPDWLVRLKNGLRAK